MRVGVYFKGDFLDVYPYMDWIFLLNHDGDLLYCRTERLISENKALHDFLFRQARPQQEGFVKCGAEILELSTEGFKKLTRLADKTKFCDLRFFYSNIFCGSEEGLQFIGFDASREKISSEQKLTDAPIASLAAKFMTVFAASLEEKVTTLFNVRENGYSKMALTGSTATRVGISDASINYYFGSKDLSLASYARSKVDQQDCHRSEQDLEKIDTISDPLDFEKNTDDVDFIFNSNGGIYLVKGEVLEYQMNNGQIHTFNLGFEGKIIRAHLFPGAKCFEFIEGLYYSSKNNIEQLLEGECISSRGYANSVNYKNSVSATNESGAYIFRLD